MSEEFIAKIKGNYYPPKNYSLKTEFLKIEHNKNNKQQYFDNKRKMKRGGPKKTW